MSAVPEWIAAVENAGVEVDDIPVDSMFPAMAQAIIASDKTIAERPEVVQGFVNAVLHAIEDIVEDPHAAAADYTANVQQYAGKEAAIEAIMRAYVSDVYPATEGLPRGAFNPERMKAVQSFYVDAGIVQNAVPLNELYTNQFVE